MPSLSRCRAPRRIFCAAAPPPDRTLSGRQSGGPPLAIAGRAAQSLAAGQRKLCCAFGRGNACKSSCSFTTVTFTCPVSRVNRCARNRRSPPSAGSLKLTIVDAAGRSTVMLVKIAVGAPLPPVEVATTPRRPIFNCSMAWRTRRMASRGLAASANAAAHRPYFTANRLAGISGLATNRLRGQFNDSGTHLRT